MLGAVTFGGKFVMAGLPNIEPVSLFVMLFAVVFGLKALFPIGIYVAMEILFYGIQLWNLNYLYIWAILAAAAWLCIITCLSDTFSKLISTHFVLIVCFADCLFAIAAKKQMPLTRHLFFCSRKLYHIPIGF